MAASENKHQNQEVSLDNGHYISAFRKKDFRKEVLFLSQTLVTALLSKPSYHLPSKILVTDLMSPYNLLRKVGYRLIVSVTVLIVT